MKNFDVAGHASMFGANVIWGLMSPLAKLVMSGGIITSLILTDLRVFGAMALFWLASLFQKQEYVTKGDLMKLFFASLLAIVFNQGCFIAGVGLTSPADASIITTSMPLWAMILAAIFLKEPVTWKKVCGIAAGACGAMLLIFGKEETGVHQGADSGIWGDLLVLGAQLSYASYLVLFKNFVSRYSMITTMKWMFTFAFICLLPFSVNDIGSTEWEALNWSEIIAIAFIVVFATFFSYMLIIVGQRKLRPTVAGMYNYIQPIVACVVAVSWGMDRLSLSKGFAIALIFSGVFLVTKSRSRTDAAHGQSSLKKDTSE